MSRRLCILIDGVDEININRLINSKGRQFIQDKISRKENLTGEEHLLSFMLGEVLHGSKIITARDSEIERSEKV